MNNFVMKSNRDGLDISMAECRAHNPRAILQIAHGMAEHKERYYRFMEYLAAQGITCVINDHRGHGASVKSAADLGCFDAEDLLCDLDQIADEISARYSGLPLMLMGHSMGALAVRALIQKSGRKFAGLIITGNPGYSPSARMGVKMAQKAQREHGPHARCKALTLGMFLPFMLKSPFWKSKNAWVCGDMDVVRAYDADPLCGFEFQASGYEGLLTLMLTACDENAPAPNKELPVKFFSGEKDPCMGGIRRLMEAYHLMKRAGYSQVEIKTYPGLRHEILNEKTREYVFSDIADTIGRYI